MKPMQVSFASSPLLAFSGFALQTVELNEGEAGKGSFVYRRSNMEILNSTLRLAGWG